MDGQRVTNHFLLQGGLLGRKFFIYCLCLQMLLRKAKSSPQVSSLCNLFVNLSIPLRKRDLALFLFLGEYSLIQFHLLSQISSVLSQMKFHMEKKMQSVLGKHIFKYCHLKRSENKMSIFKNMFL